MYSNMGLIGKPLTHTLSPFIHNYFLYKNSINGGYCCFDIYEDELGKIVEFFKKTNFKGFNVTLPYKETIIKFLDQIDDDARYMNSVNTVKIDDGKLIGYNTDIYGILETFNLYEISPIDKKILIIGAGGACRGLFYVLKKLGYGFIDIVNRNLSKAEKLVKEFNIENFRLFEVNKLNSFDNSLKYDIIINTTSVGLTGDNIYNFEKLSADIAFDMQYSLSGETLFLGKVISDKKVDGLPMLICQAYQAFKIWSGLDFENDYQDIISRLRSRR
ncbi:MAG: shikimate dehydrogenase [Calditerrivibrio sp.]|nr:shikimate dehydrogenase [Calditerrivibrio sp.]MCA1932164.1 shikimate dehydrogenase [Calditerrivibrio sp.]MCA1980127.1 shikimate dehydrogenase [Calditerrivibrio sp.]